MALLAENIWLPDELGEVGHHEMRCNCSAELQSSGNPGRHVFQFGGLMSGELPATSRGCRLLHVKGRGAGGRNKKRRDVDLLTKVTEAHFRGRTPCSTFP